MITRAVIAVVVSVAFLAAALTHYARRASRGAARLVAAGGCFVIVATVHVFEALGAFPAAGWGQPASVGHYIDLGAALLGIACLCSGIALEIGRRM